MTRLRKLMSGLALAMVVTASATAHADDQDVIDYRKHIMKTLAEQAGILGMILQNKAPADNLATHAQILATTATTAKKAFEPNVVGGEAKPAVWANWADFSKRMDAFVAAADELAKTAKTGDTAAVAGKVKELNCRGCHTEYREQKK